MTTLPILPMTRHRWRQLVGASIARVRTASAALDTNDVFFFGGLLVAARGGWLISPRWALVAGGGVLMLVGLFGIGGKR